MSQLLDRPFIRNVIASVLGAALFVPVNSTPWWMTLLRDRPFDGWLLPLLGAAVAWFAYRMGVRAGTNGIVAVESSSYVEGLRGGHQHKQPEFEESPAPASLVNPKGPSREPETTLSDSVVQMALSLKDATPVEVESQTGEYVGRRITVSGSVEEVSSWDNRMSVYLRLDYIDTAGESAGCLCYLDFEPSLTPTVKALAKGIQLRASGAVESVKPRSISLQNCKFQRIG